MRIAGTVLVTGALVASVTRAFPAGSVQGILSKAGRH